MSFQNVLWRPLHYSIGVEIGSDFADKPVDDPLHWQHTNVGFWSKGEAHLLRQIVNEVRGHWLDIGAHTGWTAVNALNGNAESVVSIEPMFNDRGFYSRFAENCAHDLEGGRIMPFPGSSDQFFAASILKGFSGAIIDGDHDDPHPLRDAVNCYERLEERGVIVLHDFRGPGPWNAGEFLAKQGMQYKIYGSVHMVGVFWRGDFTPPPEIHEGKTDWIRNYGKPGWAK